MAEETVVTVRFLNAVMFNQTENKQLNCDRDKCTLVRVQGGIEARSAKGRIFVPYANVAFVLFASETAKA